MGYSGGYLWIVGGVGSRQVGPCLGGWGATVLNRLNENRELFEVRSPIG